MAEDARAAIEAVWRIESPRVIAALARSLRDLEKAEDLAQEALVRALEHWPRAGVPDNPGAWLLAAAKNLSVDQARRAQRFEERRESIGRESEEREQRFFDPADGMDGFHGDDLLRLIFVACHPILPRDARVALTLRLLGGLTVGEIARAFLVPEPTLAQRIVRAKRALAEARVPFEVPEGAALRERLEGVLEVLYLIFNEGYSATAGSDWVRPALCEDAMRLGRVLASLAPDEPEVHGLTALMELQASRLRARTDARGNPILLNDQNRGLWDRLLIERGLLALSRAMQPEHHVGTYTLQAAIAACHARARTPQETDWKQITALYTALLELNPSPVIELNRIVAVSMAEGPAAALPLLDALEERGELRGYHLVPSVRADLLIRLDRLDAARAALGRAIELAQNRRERELLESRLGSLAPA